MLMLAILLTIVAAILFATGFALAGYVLITKIREYRQSSGSNNARLLHEVVRPCCYCCTRRPNGISTTGQAQESSLP